MFDGCLKRRKTGNQNILSFEIPPTQTDVVWNHILQVEEKTNGYHRVRLGKPSQPRSTGYRSQNHRIRGHCKDISDQIKYKEWNPGMVHDLMKLKAVETGGYRYMKFGNYILPFSEADINKEEANLLIEIIQQFADERSFWLTEYDDLGRKYKSVGGRTRSEMVEYEKQYGKIN